MKRLIYCLVWFAAVVFTGCTSNVDPSATVYTGVVVEQNSMMPLSGLEVRITDGVNVYAETQTNSYGQFSLNLTHNSSLVQLYIYIDGNNVYPSKEIELIYTEASKYDYGMIYLFSQTDEMLFPFIENVSWYFPNDNKSIYFKDISIISPYKLEETYIEVSQSSDLRWSTKYQLERQSNGKFSAVVGNFVVGEKYYFQVVATNTIGTGRSDLYCRTFGMSIPQIVEITNATVNTATISIKITEEPIETLSSGICWSTSPSPTINDFSAMAGSNAAAEVTMTDVDFSKRSYYVRAYAQNANGISYSEDLMLPVNNPYNLPTFKSGGQTYTYRYMGKASWYSANNTCNSSVFVFDNWVLPSIGVLGDFINAYYAENEELPPMPFWSMRNYEDWEYGETETFLYTTNGLVMWNKNESHHYFAVRKF